MIISTGRLLVAAAVVLVAVLGAGWIGRTSAPRVGGAGSSTIASPSPESSAASSQPPTVESFRAARNAICQAANPILQPLKDALAGVYDASLPVAARATKVDALNQIVIQGQALRAQLAALEVPPQLAADQTAALTRSEDVQAILEQEIVLLRADKLSEAKELDLTTDPINRQVEQFEQRYGLAPCP